MCFHYWGNYFKARVKINPITKCWEWSLSKNRKGYGQCTYKGKYQSAHRLSYYLYYNVDPGKLHVCHKCDNPGCVNPEHLWLGTNYDNHKDKIQKGRAKYALEFNNANCKLSNADVFNIRKRYEVGGETHRSLAKEYGVNHRLIGRIINYKERVHAHLE